MDARRILAMGGGGFSMVPDSPTRSPGPPTGAAPSGASPPELLHDQFNECLNSHRTGAFAFAGEGGKVR
jgi:hypothetical protein